MSTPPSLPGLPGLTWSRHKKPGFSTRVASHVSGREVRVALMDYPLYEFASAYSGLASASTAAFAGLGSASLQNLMGFFLQLQGQFGTFLYADPDDNTVSAQAIGVGDGSTQAFVMGRSLGGWNEPVCWVTAIADIYLNGVAQASGNFLLTAPNMLAFATPPAAGAAITADFSFAFQCRFLDDQIDFEEFMSALWRLDSLKFRSIKANTATAGAMIPGWYSAFAVSGQAPTLFADTTTEGGANHYYYNGSTCGSFAALLTALGISFTRSTAAYYVNSAGQLVSAAGNTPRFDYGWNGSAFASRGLLLEGASTNVVQNSQALNASGWNIGDLTIATAAASAPDGTTTANLLTEDTSATLHRIYQSATVTANQITTLSVFLKYVSRQYAILEASDGAARRFFAVVDLINGVVTQTGVETPASGASCIGSGLTRLANGWYRLTVTGTLATGQTTLYSQLGLSNTGTPGAMPSYAGASEAIYAWGFQSEQLPFASSYIPTTSAAASRGTDSLSAATWPAITAGTLYAEADTLYPSQLQRLIEINDGTANNKAALSFNSSAAGAFDFVDGGSAEAALSAGTITASAPVQVAAAFQANDFALVANGGAAATASSGAVPSFGKLYLGQGATGNPLFGHLAQFGAWNNLRGPNASLQALT